MVKERRRFQWVIRKMIRDRKLLLLLLLVGILGVSYLWMTQKSQRQIAIEQIDHIKNRQGAYFLPIKISKFTAANQPCLSAEIDQKTISVMLDLGFRGQFGFSSDVLKTIENKTYLQSTTMYGICGAAYKENLFKIPKISVGSVVFSEPEVHEYSETFHIDATLIEGNEQPSSPEPGKVGWELFGNINLFLDLKHSKLSFCDSLSTLVRQGYQEEAFVKVPLLLDRGLVEIEVQTELGLFRCMLDTGSTWNVLNTENRAYEQTYVTARRELFLINSTNFGPLDFHLVPIKMPIAIEGILGMEFFQEHCVFLDFSEHSVYFSKAR